MVLSAWICMLLIAVPTFIMTEFETTVINYFAASAFAIQVTVIGFGIVAYTLIGLVVIRKRKLTERPNHESKILKVSTAIIITYFLFEMVPSIVFAGLSKCCIDVIKTYSRLYYAVTAFNSVSDPIIYIDNYPPLKAVVEKKLKFITSKLSSLDKPSSTMDVSRPRGPGHSFETRPEGRFLLRS